MLTDDERRALADRILQAIATGTPIDPPSDTLPLELPDSRAIQNMVVAGILASGAVFTGHKVGFTSKAMQEMYGITSPDFGRLFDRYAHANGATVATAGLCDPRVEPEIAFVLRDDLRGPGATIEDVLEATDFVCASIEIIDSRVGSTRARGVDSIADNAGAGGYVLGDVRLGPRDVDLAAIAVSITVDGETLEGRGEDAMGHPAAAVAWLADKLAEFDEGIAAGSVVLPGSVTRSVAVGAGSTLHADFGPLGAVDVAFA